MLWIGNAIDARDIRAVLSLGTRAVVDLAANALPVQYPSGIAECRLPLGDGPGNDVTILQLAVFTTAELVRSKVPTFVACSAGMSRSPVLVAAALSIVEKAESDAVLARIARMGPHDVAPALWLEVKNLIYAN